MGFVSFLVSYSVENDISEAAAGLLLGGVSLASAASRIVLGSVLDRSRADALMPLALMLAVSVGGYLLLMADQPALIVVAALVAGSLGWAWPGGLNLAVVQRSPEAPAWAVGVMMTGLFGGAVAGPLLVGVLADHGHFDGAWLLCGALRAGGRRRAGRHASVRECRPRAFRLRPTTWRRGTSRRSGRTTWEACCGRSRC